MASLDVKTVFDVATPSVVKQKNHLRGHGRVVAALLAGMRDLERFHLFRALRDAVPLFEMHSAGRGGVSSVVGTRGQIRCVEKPRRPRVGLEFGGEVYDEYLSRGMMLADNWW